jgi:hypothetical protein
MVEDDVDTDAVDGNEVGGTGVVKLNVRVCPGIAVAAGFPDNGVDAASVASRFEVGVGADVPRLQARIVSKSPIQIKSFLFIFFLD